MPAKVVLSIVKGDEVGREFAYEQRTTCVVGRSRSANLRIEEQDAPKKISRHHCLLDINPPDIRIRDFGSRNGTFVNGELIGKRQTVEPVEGAENFLPEVKLYDGDEIRIRLCAHRMSSQIIR